MLLSVSLTEREAMAQNHFVHRKKALQWNSMFEGKMQTAHTQIGTLYTNTKEYLPVFFPWFRLIDTHTFRLQSLGHTPDCIHYTLLILLPSCWCVVSQAGCSCTEMSARQGAGKKGVWSMEPPSRRPCRSVRHFDYILLCFLMKLNYWRRTAALPWSYWE